jgi:hypothetical protein
VGTKCPKCGHDRQPSDPAPDYECPKCGIVYAKASAKPVTLSKAVEPAKPSRIGLFAGGIMLVVAGAFIGLKVVGPASPSNTPESIAKTAAMDTKSKAEDEDRERKAQEEEFKKRQDAERDKQALDKAAADLSRQYQRWKDGSALADSTARIALSGPVSNLQTIRREVNDMIVPACMDGAKAALIEGMDAQIRGFMLFMQDANLGKLLAKPEFQEASDAFGKYEFRAKSCPTGS